MEEHRKKNLTGSELAFGFGSRLRIGTLKLIRGGLIDNGMTLIPISKGVGPDQGFF